MKTNAERQKDYRERAKNPDQRYRLQEGNRTRQKRHYYKKQAETFDKVVRFLKCEEFLKRKGIEVNEVTITLFAPVVYEEIEGIPAPILDKAVKVFKLILAGSKMDLKLIEKVLEDQIPGPIIEKMFDRYVIDKTT